jgi:hypothetical protein
VEAHYIWSLYRQINVCGFDEWTYGLPKKVHLEIKSAAESQDFHVVSLSQSDSY